MSASNNMVYGLHAVQALINESPQRVQQLFLLRDRNDKRLQSILSTSEKYNIPVSYAMRKKLDQITKGGSHQGIVAIKEKIIEIFDEFYLKSYLAKLHSNNVLPFILVLDGVTDPHNLGACFRSAEAAGVQCIIVPKDNAAPLNATASKVACGAAEVLPLIRVTNLARTLTWLQSQGIWLIGTSSKAQQDYFEMNLNGALAIVMGAEGKGLRRLTRERCDKLIRIPMMGRITTSLNISVAAGICLFEVLRQRILSLN